MMELRQLWDLSDLKCASLLLWCSGRRAVRLVLLSQPDGFTMERQEPLEGFRFLTCSRGLEHFLCGLTIYYSFVFLKPCTTWFSVIS